MDKKIIFAGLIGALIIILGGLYFFIFSKSNQGVATTDDSSDWCKSKELSKSQAGDSSDPDLAIPKENIPGLVQEAAYYAQLASQEAEKKGVKISQSEFCALYIAMDDSRSEGVTSLLYNVTVAGLAKYIGNDRATIVLDYQRREAAVSGDVSAKATMAYSVSAIRRCILEKENRVLEPKSNQPLCQKSQQNSQNTALWGDLELIGGKWGGCDFQVIRNADGTVSDVQYCAVLPSGIQAVCTLSRCSYGGD